MKKRILSILVCLVMVLTTVNFAFAAEVDSSSTAVTNPFRSDVTFNAGGSMVTSNSYRIPAMVTLDDGTIVAAADVRWNTTYDGGGLDTLVARSTNGGATWSYTLANYLDDNGNEYNAKSTAFIDPALTVAEDGKTVYMLCDLYSYGVALDGDGQQTAPEATKAFNEAGNLILHAKGEVAFSYYLRDGKIHRTSGEVVEGYDVDDYFNITYNNGESVSNLFCEDSPFHVVRTGYLCLTKSTDGGKTWSAPTLLNLEKSSDMETVCLVGPGRGLTTADGTMVFPIYGKHQWYGNKLGFIYSKDGVEWKRVNSSISNSSEAAVVEIGEGTLRFFYRQESTSGTLCYIDYDLNAGTWGSAVNTGVKTNSNTQMSAITYSKTVDGNQVILVSCPTGPNAEGSSSSDGSNRLNGRIFAGIVAEDGTMTWEEAANVTGAAAANQITGTNSVYTEADGFFAYSCLTERADGSVAILYENEQHGWGAGSDKYFAMNMKAFTSEDLNVEFDAAEDGEGSEEGDEEGDDITTSCSTKVGDVTITIEGEMPGGTTVAASEYEIKNPSEFGLSNTSNVKGAYDIKLLDKESNAIQPEQDVFVIMDATAMGLEDGDVVEVIHQHGSKINKSRHVVINGELVFPTSGFSVFIVNQINNPSGTQLIGNSANNPYKMTIGESKIFYDNNVGNGYSSYRGEWQVVDESMAIGYEITSLSYQNYQYQAPYIEVEAKDVGTVRLIYKYVRNNSINQETMYIEVVAPERGLYVKDQVAESGCLVPAGLDDNDGVTYSWARSDGQVIRTEALNTDGSVNLSLDRGGLTEGRNPITYTVTATLPNGTTEVASYEVLYSNEILNTSFENTPVASNLTNQYFYNGYPGLYWKTTAPGSTSGQLTQDIEIIKQGSGATSSYGVGTAADGVQFAELNAENYGALYQDILSTPGATLSWSFSHNGRTTSGSSNTMYVVIAATEDASSVIAEADVDALLDAIPNGANVPSSGAGYKLSHNGATYYVWKHIADKDSSKWEEISGTYTVPEGQYLTRLFFASDTNAGKNYNNTMGNLIDAVSAGETMDYKIEYYVDNKLVSGDTQTGKATLYTTVDLKNLQKYVNQGYVLTGAKVGLKNGDADYPGNVNNGFYITSYGSSSDSNYGAILKVYLAKRAVTITKNIVIEGWANMTDEERADIIGNGLTSKFELSGNNGKTYDAELTIIGVSATGELTAMGEFKDGNSAPVNGTYTVTETIAPQVSGYSLQGATFDKKTVEISDRNPTAAIKCTNIYVRAVGNLVIKKTGIQLVDNDIHPNNADTLKSVEDGESQSTIFQVTGPKGYSQKVVIHGNDSVTIEDLLIGEYTVTEITDWSWRYTPETGSKTITLKPTPDENVVSFNNVRNNPYWLNGGAYNINNFTVNK